MGHPFETERERIVEFPLRTPGVSEGFDLPSGAEIVHVGLSERGEFALFVRADRLSPTERRTFRSVATNEEFPKDATYLGTVYRPRTGHCSHIIELT